MAGSGLWDPFSFNGVVGYVIVIMLLFTFVMMIVKIFFPEGMDGLW